MTKRRTAGARSGRSRRGKGEDMTGSKAATVEVRSVVAEELKLAKPEDILHHIKSVKGWKERIATMNSSLSGAYKAAKAAKISKKTLDFLLGLERGDANDFRREMETVGVGLKAVGAPFQLNVFDIAYGSDVEQAKAEATAAAKAGRGPECRYAEGSEAYDAYMETYALVQSGLVPGADLLSDTEKADAIAAGRAADPVMEMQH